MPQTVGSFSLLKITKKKQHNSIHKMLVYCITKHASSNDAYAIV